MSKESKAIAKKVNALIKDCETNGDEELDLRYVCGVEFVAIVATRIVLCLPLLGLLGLLLLECT
jgi:hypothetical protein